MNSHFSIEWFDILNFMYTVIMYNYSISILDINPLSVNALVNTLFQLTFFTFLMGSSGTQFLHLKFYNLFYMSKRCLKKKSFLIPKSLHLSPAQCCGNFSRCTRKPSKTCRVVSSTEVTILGITCPHHLLPCHN